MWTQTRALFFLLTGCLWSAAAQSSRRQNIWDEPIKFTTKGKDLCTMMITGQGVYTRLRLSCQGSERSYWCEYLGKPYTCRAYNNNPRHYFVQMMWGLRKLHNACLGSRQIRPQMCKKATDESQMIFSTASFSQSWPEAASRTRERPATQPARPQTTAPTRHDSARKASTQAIHVPPVVKTTQPTTPASESNAKRIARQYCWRSLQGICSYAIGLFWN